jgi:hypothetical protein
MLVEAKLILPLVECKFKSPLVVVSPSFHIFVTPADKEFRLKFVFELIVSCFVDKSIFDMALYTPFDVTAFDEFSVGVSSISKPDEASSSSIFVFKFINDPSPSSYSTSPLSFIVFDPLLI